ncbi:MAG TPA: ribose-5-phosphate isomerase RpiA [Flavitalea sp.]|nr:ribose-5-phosphate isomerase RpiA [Flavitalea sp.]
MEAKAAAAEKAVEYIENGMTVGLGSGSTSYYAIRKIGERVSQGLRIRAVASSTQTASLARECRIRLTDLTAIDRIDITIDGADEVDKQLNLIKGGGGALLREKILAYNSRQTIIIVDDSKLVDILGKFPLPVEVAPFAVDLTLAQLKRFKIDLNIREVQKEKFITDNGNLIVDCHFSAIRDPEELNMKLLLIPGIIETGLFPHTPFTRVIVGYADGATQILGA